MVVQGIIALALALPTGMLFGVGYGTGVRIGNEQIYPLLFPQSDVTRSPEQVAEQIKNINTIYNTIGGKEASQMGMADGIATAGELLDNPDFRVLEELESRLSGRTPGSSRQAEPSSQTGTSGSTLGSSARAAIGTSNIPGGQRRPQTVPTSLRPPIVIPQAPTRTTAKVNTSMAQAIQNNPPINANSRAVYDMLLSERGWTTIGSWNYLSHQAPKNPDALQRAKNALLRIPENQYQFFRIITNQTPGRTASRSATQRTMAQIFR